MDHIVLQSFLDVAVAEHENAKHPEDIAYWQGRKDAVRTLLALELNDVAPLQQIVTSVFYTEKLQREFEISPMNEVEQGACIECGATYFHKPGCRHGLGLSAEELERRLKLKGG